MSTMTPTYIKMSGFDTEHSRFATKYSLYFYREEGVDPYTRDNIGLRGVPVLFLPGNAGSYKQVRSLSSEASRYFYSTVQHDHEALRDGASAMDFFMVDFNEDLAAFHGQTIIDQADYVNEAVAYILTLYHDPRRSRRDPELPDPSSVILIGHSMGGMVARTALATPNYQSNSINTIITMSTPHARPPLSFDADMVHTYQRVNDFWRNSYLQNRPGHNPLQHTTLISFAGGGLDTMIPSDYTSVASLVPESHGFTVFTSTIPNLWSSMDHLAITWCDQFRKVLIRSLFEVIDIRRAAQTKSRTERMRVFRKWLLTGLEDAEPMGLINQDPSILLTLGDGPRRTAISPSNNITLRSLGRSSQSHAQLLRLPAATAANDRLVTVLTDQAMSADGGFDKLELLFCSAFPLPRGHSNSLLPTQIDLSDGNPGATRLACKTAYEDMVPIPASTRSSKNAFDLVPPFTWLQYDAVDLADHQFLAVVHKTPESSRGWLIAEAADMSRSSLVADITMSKLLMSGLRLELPADRPTMMNVHVPALHSSLLAWSLQLDGGGCGNKDGELFTPLVRQYIEHPYESKFLVNVKRSDINLHGSAPFVAPTLPRDPYVPGVSFQLWSDPTCNASLTVSLTIDIMGSLGKLVMRYRTLLAAFPLLVVAMVLRKQFRTYDSTGAFITFTESLDGCLRTSLPVLLLAVTLYATSWARSATSMLGYVQATNVTASEVDHSQNDVFLGSTDTFFWFLVPLAGLVSVGVCIAVNYVVLALVHLLALVATMMPLSSSHAKQDEQQALPTAVIHSTLGRRAINTGILLALVIFFIPYQFAYVVACMVQLAASTRALRLARDTGSTAAKNLFNYTYSIAMLMFWLLPINLPVLIVWMHNLALHWLTPFSSHHNVLSIMPFILLVETSACGIMIPRVRSRLRFLTNGILFGLAVFTAMYGITYAYMLHHLVNFVALWLVVVHLPHPQETPCFSFQSLSSAIDGTPALDEVKKMP